MTYPYAPDRQLEPDDDSAERQAFEDACHEAWMQYLDDGSLPDGRDSGDVDELLSEYGMLDDLLRAMPDSRLLEVAKAIRDKRQAIVDSIIRESLNSLADA